jgi:hypothetical protein
MAETNQFSGDLFLQGELENLNELNLLFRRRAVIEAILDGKGAQKGKLRFALSDDQEDEELTNRFLRYVHYHVQDSSADKGWSHIDLTRGQEDRELEIRLDQPLSMVLSNSRDVPSHQPLIEPIGAPGWSALAMIRDGEPKEDGKVWEVKATVPADWDQNKTRGLKLDVLLDAPLPRKEEW